MKRTIADDLMDKGHARGQLETARATLVRQLCVRFGELPDRIVATVQATTDLEQLNTWLDRVVTADTLEDISIGL